MLLPTLRSQVRTRPPPFTTTSFGRFHIASKSNCSVAESLAADEEETCSLLLRALRRCVETNDLRKAKVIHAKFIKGALVSTMFLRNHLLNVHVKCGDLRSGLQLFEEMPEKNVVSWTAVIAGFVQHGRPEKAISLFCRMNHNGMKPNEFTFVSALHACSFFESLTHAYQVYAKIVRFGFESNIFLLNAFLTALIRHNKLSEALEVFEECQGKDIVTWNAMMAGYVQFSYSQVPGFWFRMNREGVKPDNFTFASVLTGLTALSDLKMGMQVHAQLVKSGHGSEMCVGNSLVSVYLENQNLVDGIKAFDEIPCRDVCSWTQMAAGCLNCGEANKALGIIREMRKLDVMPNKFTLATALSACANLASLEEGKKVHGLRIKLGDDVDVCVDNALIDMYAKCGCMKGALGVFRSMEDHSVVSWTSMIMGFAQNGHAREALKFFDEMRKGSVEPNYITFICVLYACSERGFIDEGWKYFSSMTHDHGISPTEDHYACMVNLLGRAGRIKEAEELIRGMPFQPGVLVWQTLLGACQLHGDVETAKCAAEHAFDLDKEDPSTYVLLSNMFAGLSNWEDVGTLRKLMDARDVKKMPGSSWIETNRDHLLPTVDGRFI